MMGGNPEPISKNITFVKEKPSGNNNGVDRDDNPRSWP